MIVEHNKNSNNEDFLRLLAKSEPIVRGYLRSLIQDHHDISDVMQNVFIVSWKKYSQFKGTDDDFCKWACVIARYEALKHRQNKKRDRFVLGTDILDKIADEGLENTAESSQWLHNLEHCLTQLSQSNRELVHNAYSPEISIKDYAKECNTTADALYQKLRRIRTSLSNCMDKLAPQEG